MQARLPREDVRALVIVPKQRLTSATTCPMLRLLSGQGMGRRAKSSSSRFLPFQGKRRITAHLSSGDSGFHQPCEEVSHVVKT